MVTNLVEKGNLEKPVILFNRTEKRATDLSAKLPSGKTVVSTSIEDAVAKADIIFTMLGDDNAVKDTIAAALKNDVKGKLFVECSTVHPDVTEFIAKSVQEKEAEMVACPGEQILQKRRGPTMLTQLQSFWCASNGRCWSTDLRSGWSSTSSQKGHSLL